MKRNVREPMITARYYNVNDRIRDARTPAMPSGRGVAMKDVVREA